MSKKIIAVLGCLLLATAVSCGGGGDEGEGEGEMFKSDECVGGGWCGEQSITVTADLGGAEALFISSESSSIIGSVSAEKAITASSESPLFSVTTSGIISVLAAAYESNEDALSSLPRLSFVAVSPIGHVILVFEHPFIFTETAADGTSIDNYSDPWAESSPFTCQIFVVNKKIQDIAAGEDPQGLTCLTTELVMNTWDFRAAMVQFDGDGGVYFTAHVPQNWKNVLIKWTPGTDAEGINGSLSEVINANICFREYLVTNEGGVLYSGVTSTTGDCSGTSFLRYLTPAGGLTEITSGWWEYVFKPIESTDFESLNIAANVTTANVGQILFYGPDPEIATTPDWEDACLFKFNPAESGTARSVQIADCDIDIWRYVDWAPDLDTKKTRCTETKNMMGGGNIPEKIMLADLNGDGSDYEIYVVGQIYEKKEGEWRCDLCVRDKSEDGIANYCYLNGNLHFEATTAGTCATVDEDGDGTPDGATWGNDEDCYHQQVYSASTGNICDTTSDDFDINGQWCEQPGGDWRDTYSAFAWVVYDDNDTDDEDDDTRQIVRFSDDDEIVRKGWVISNRLVYSSFNTDTGEYNLREVIWTPSAEGDTTVDIAEISKTDLLTGIEVYELFADPRSTHAGLWFFNGLRFEDNQYITGTFNPAPETGTPADTLETEADITGQIETLVIVPSF